jgi:hypothetical protein
MSFLGPGYRADVLLTQLGPGLSLQPVIIPSGERLTGILAESAQQFKPVAPALGVTVLCQWTLSLIFSLNCALSAALMQQWARHYQELVQRSGASNRLGRIWAYIFAGVNRSGMARVVVTTPHSPVPITHPSTIVP